MASRNLQDAERRKPLVHGATPDPRRDVWSIPITSIIANRRPDYLKAFLDHW